MGISAIKCDGYSDVKESGFGNGHESASDFSRASISLTALGLAAAAGISLVSMPSETAIEKEGPVTVGRVEGAYKGGHLIKAEDDIFDAGQQVALYPIENGILDSDAPLSNLCRVTWEHPLKYGKAIYAAQCATPVRKDGLEVGDYVALYRAYDK